MEKRIHHGWRWCGRRPHCQGSRATGLLLWVALAICSSPAAAAGGDKAMAESLFQAGKTLMGQGKLDEACPKFAESMRLEPAVGAILNLARCYELQGKTASAWAGYQQGADMAAAAGQDKRAAEARKLALQLSLQLSKLTIEAPSGPAGLEVRHGEVVVGPGALGVPVAVDPGSHTVEARAPGYRTWTETVTVGAAGDQRTIVVPALESGSDEPGDGDATAHYALAAAATGIGAAGLVLGTVYGVQASSTWDDAQEQCPQAPTYCDAAGVQLSEEAGDAATISTVTFVVGGVGLAAAVALWATIPTVPEGGDAAAAVRLLPIVSDRSVGLTLVGEF